MLVNTALPSRLAVVCGLVMLGFLLHLLGGGHLWAASIAPTIIKAAPAHTPGSTRPQSAGNETLGFQTIRVINLPRRYDRADTLVLQSSVTNINLHISDGVDASTTKDNYGMPPNSMPGYLKDTEKACFRAHANLWRQMLHEKWASALIMEADAAWDINVRAITERLSHAFNDLMDAYPRSLNDARPSELDPYNVAKWDLLSLGQCHENTRHNNESLVYSDPDAPLNMEYYGKKLVDERVVRRSGGPACTTAYALSPRGALKLLVKFNVDTNIPLDLAIRSMIEAEELIAYSVQPTIIAQWIYREGSGAESANSEVSKVERVDGNADTWKDIHETMNVWGLKPYHEDARFRNGALQALGRFAWGEKENAG